MSWVKGDQRPALTDGDVSPLGCAASIGPPGLKAAPVTVLDHDWNLPAAFADRTASNLRKFRTSCRHGVSRRWGRIDTLDRYDEFLQH